MGMTRQSVMAVAVAVMFGAGGAVLVAEKGTAGQADQQATAQDGEGLGEQMADELLDREQGQLLEASGITRMQVQDQSGEEIGRVSDLAIDTRHGQLAYAILELKEALEHEEQGQVNRFAVPWAALRIASDGPALELTVDHQRLVRGHVFDDDQWERLSDHQWALHQHEALDVRPYWERDGEYEADDAQRADPAQEGEADVSMQLADHRELRVESMDALIGRDVHAPGDEALAKVDDFMIDTRRGHLAYTILRYGGIIGIGDSYVAVPSQAFELDEEEERFVLDADQDKLDRIAYDSGEQPDMTDAQWSQRVHDMFGQEPYWQVFGYGPPSKVADPEEEEQQQGPIEEILD